MLYTCVQKFDMTRNLKNFWELNMAQTTNCVLFYSVYNYAVTVRGIDWLDFN